MEVDDEQKRKALETLVAPLSAEEWGQKETTTAPPPLTVSAPKEGTLTEEKYDGVSDSGSESGDDDEDPVVLEGDEVDFAAEMDDFLKFTKEILGLTDDQYAALVDGKTKGQWAATCDHCIVLMNDAQPQSLPRPRRQSPSQCRHPVRRYRIPSWPLSTP